MVLSLVASIGKLSLAIYDQSQMVKGNQKQCQRLAERITLVSGLIQSLAQEGKLQQQPQEVYVEALSALNATLEEALTLVKSFQGGFWLKQVIVASGYQDKFNQIYQQLAESMQQLNLSLSIKQVIDSKQDQEDRSKDHEALLAKQDEIIAEAKASKLEMQRLAMEDSKRHEVLTKQIASMQYALMWLQSERKEEKSKILHGLFVPFFQLEIDSLLASGGFGDVYLGRYLLQTVAIKLLERDLSTDERKEFIREVRIMQKLRSDYIVPIYAVCDEPGRACIVMKYMEQGSLRRVLDSQANLSLKQRHQLALDVVLGLYYLHSQNIVHRDLNSRNILVDSEGRARLSDFGLSNSKSGNITSLDKHSMALRWLPPEILMSDGVNRRVNVQGDVYSLGMVLWEIMTGRYPYEGYSDLKLVSEITKGEREDIPENIPKVYRDIIAGCWRAEPNKRPQLENIARELSAYILPEAQPMVQIRSQVAFWQTGPVSVKKTDEVDLPEAFFTAGYYYEKQGEFKKAKDCYQKAMDIGHVKAITNLAMLYMDGRGVDPDKEKASILLNKAAGLGHDRAIGNLAHQLEKGDGVKRDLDTALKWYAKLAEKGDERAKKKHLQLKKELADDVLSSTQPSRTPF